MLYGIAMLIRLGCYRLGILKSISMSVPVVVVGGLSVGGSGKTPVVLALIKRFQDQGRRPGVISRGYKGCSEFWPRQVGDNTTAQIVGDEPQLIFELTRAAVVVGPDRPSNGVQLIDKLNCDVLISDDGFAHHRLKRDVDIVVIDGQLGYGNGWCLPAGPLREFPSQLRRADIVLVNSIAETSAEKTLMPPKLQTSMVTVKLFDAYNLNDGSRKMLTEFANNTVHAVAGLGNPARFFQQLRQLGLDVIEHPFPDHHKYSESDLGFAEGSVILMTEKDGIKCRDMSIAKNLWAVPATLEMDDQVFEQIDRIIEDRQSTPELAKK